MTLQEALRQTPAEEIFQHIHAKDLTGKPDLDIESVRKAYGPVITSILGKPVVPSPYPIAVVIQKDGDEEYPDVSYRNPSYEAPPENLKPWGCSSGETPPEGYYDINNEKYSERLGFGFDGWGEIAHAEIENNTQLGLPGVVGEILWEATFYGFDEQSIEALSEKMQERVESIKSGGGITFPFDPEL